MTYVNGCAQERSSERARCSDFSRYKEVHERAIGDGEAEAVCATERCTVRNEGGGEIRGERERMLDVGTDVGLDEGAYKSRRE